MNLSEFYIPYRDNEDIWPYADSLRNQYVTSETYSFDIVSIVENDLRFRIIPLPGLKEECETEAWLHPDLSAISADLNHYIQSPASFRFRFSLAHELGHWMLHDDIIPEVRPDSVEEWRDQSNETPKLHRRLEVQAREFAGRFLVNPELLKKECQEIYEEVRSSLAGVPEGKIRKRIGHKIHMKFDVSEDVIFRRIINEGIRFL